MLLQVILEGLGLGAYVLGRFLAVLCDPVRNESH